MSTNANQEFSNANTATNDDLPEGSDTTDDSYASRLDKTPVPVIPDETSVEQPNDAKNPNSKETLERDEAEAMDKSNILKGGRTRGAAKPAGTFQEPDDEEGLPPPDDGTSAVR